MCSPVLPPCSDGRRRGTIASVTDVVDELRAAAAEVCRRARHVRLDEDRIPGYAQALQPSVEAQIAAPPDPAAHLTRGDPETLKAFWLTLDAINFGSGWFPTLHKRPGRSGYFTVAIGLRERFEAHGPWTPDELQSITAADIADTLGQAPDHELMALFARSLNDLGTHSLPALTNAVALAETLSTWSCFADTSTYEELRVPFLKRAQITAADLHQAGLAGFPDLHRLTMFADNLVPHVLRTDGLLSYDQALATAISRGDLLVHGSRPEVEIRAAAVHAVEAIAAHTGLSPADIDKTLWNRGQQPAYKALPRHRCRCTAY
jgi:hypothetical protein